MRSLLTFKLGAWVGIVIAALFTKRVLPSRGDATSDELALVAVFDGIDLRSEASEFKGGSMLAWFGGISLDLRDAVLADGARLSVNTFLGGIAVTTPPNWRIEGNARAVFGGVKVDTPAQDDPDAPVLTIEGRALLGGIAIGDSATHDASQTPTPQDAA
jgi:hypothetical protein